MHVVSTHPSLQSQQFCLHLREVRVCPTINSSKIHLLVGYKAQAPQKGRARPGTTLKVSQHLEPADFHPNKLQHVRLGFQQDLVKIVFRGKSALFPRSSAHFPGNSAHFGFEFFGIILIISVQVSHCMSNPARGCYEAR